MILKIKKGKKDGSRGQQPRPRGSRSRRQDSARGHDSTSSRPRDSGRGIPANRAQDSGHDLGSSADRAHDSGHDLGSPADQAHGSSPADQAHGSSTGERQGRSRLVPLTTADVRHLGHGYAGSNSVAGVSDPLGDMQGVFRRHNSQQDSQEGRIDPDNESDDDDERDSNIAETPELHAQRPWIEKIGNKFASFEVHHQIRRIFDQFFKGPWPTYTKLPPEVRKQMFKHFGTYYRWSSKNDGAIQSAFNNVLKARYSDIMREYRGESARRARAAGHTIPKTDDDFTIMRDHPPLVIDDVIWIDLCKYWDTKSWRNKSKSGRSNRLKGDRTGMVSRHTGGSRGYDQYRLVMTKELKRAPTFMELFLATHLTTEAKKKLKAGDYDKVEDLEFCTPRAREICVRYRLAMIERYGEDLSKHPEGDVELWVQAQEGSSRGHRIYGIGSSNLHFVVTGTSSQGNSSTFTDYEQSKRRVQELEERQAEMAARQSQLESQMAEMVEFMKRHKQNPPNDDP